MVYIGPTLAGRVDLTRDVTVEYLINGGILLTAVTNERFDPRRDDHLAAALRIQEALAPLNETRNMAERH